jgi:hypothetical protein
MRVASPSVEVEVRLWLALKTWSVGRRGGLPFLRHEKMVAPAGWEAVDAKVPKALLTSMESARKTASALLDDDRVTAFEDVKRVMVKSGRSLVAVDRSFRIELEFLEICGAEVATKADSMLVEMLPPEGSQGEIQASLSRVQRFLDGQSGRFCSHETRGRAEALCELLTRFQGGAGPDKSKFSGPFWDRVLSTLPRFCSARASNGDTLSGTLSP